MLKYYTAGLLRTSGKGTVLEVAHSLHKEELLCNVFCIEMKLCNQGSWLKVLNLMHEGIPAMPMTDPIAAASHADRGGLLWWPTG